ncbi:MAG: prepilin-type N-terminal cleavage/methylation domain-containing protein [Sulfurimonas sp.]
MKTHGSRVTRGHGMRRGISLIEMLMAIVLLGLLGGISFNYYKVYYDVDFAAKQAKVYVILDQATQLSGAHDLYTVKNGLEPTTVAAMVTDKQLLRIPDPIPEITAAGWVLLPAVEVDGGTTAANDVAFTYAIDTAAGTDLASQVDYCNILTNTSSTATWSLSSTATNIGAIGTDIATGYAEANWGNDYFCYSSAAPAADKTMTMVFVKRVDAN